MSTNGQDNAGANTGQPASDRASLAILFAAALLVAIGLGGVAARDLQPLTQQQSFWAELSYLLTHPDAFLHLVPYAIIYVVILGILSFARLVLIRLAPRWAAEVADASDAWLRLHFTRFYARYRQSLYFHLRSLDQKGMPDPRPWNLDLDQVFVDLKVEPQALSAGQANPVQPLYPELRAGQHPFFEFLTPRRGAAPHLVIIGPPGSGKTTMLRHAALLMVAGRKQRARATVKVPSSLRRSMPILLYLREHAAQVQYTVGARHNGKPAASYSLEDAVNEYLRLHESSGLLVPKGWLLRRLRRGRCLILLDGLDEIADESQRRVLASWVQEQVNQYPTCRFAVTSRPHGYKGNTLNGVTLLGMCPYTHTQIQDFVRKWYHATAVTRRGGQDDPGVRSQARLEADKLLHRLEKVPDVYALATNPLLLTMICIVHLNKGGLPKRRVDLYKDACDVFLIGRLRAKDLPVTLTEDEAKGVLAPLAWEMMTKPWLPEDRKDRRCWPTAQVVQTIAAPLAQLTDMQADEFLQNLHESGLFLELEPGEYGFAHRTFQEYLAAVHADRAQLEPELIAHVGDSWWEETIRLYCAQTDATRASRVIEACLPQGEELPQADALALALACLEERETVRLATRSRLQQFIDRCVDAPDAERQHLAAEALLTKRVRDMIPLGDTTRFSPTLVTNVEYQLFLDDARAHGEDSEYHEPPHWTTPHYAAGQGHNPVLGMLANDVVAFCAWLTGRNASKGNAFRVPFERESKTQQFQSTIQSPGFPADTWVTDEAGRLMLIHTTSHHANAGIEQFDATVRQDTEVAGCPNLFVRIHDHYLSLIRSRDFVSASASSNAWTLALASIREGVLKDGLAEADALARDLKRASNPDLDLKRERSRNLARARALEHGDLDRARDRDLKRALSRARSLARALSRASDLDRARTLERDLDHAVSRTSARDPNTLSRARDLACDLARDLTRDLTRDLSASDVDRDHARAFALALALALALAIASALSATDFDRTLKRFRVLTLASAGTLASAFADPQAALRISLLQLAGISSQRIELSKSQADTQTIETMIDMYTALVVMKGRTKGWLRPSEGIMLVCDVPQ